MSIATGDAVLDIESIPESSASSSPDDDRSLSLSNEISLDKIVGMLDFLPVVLVFCRDSLLYFFNRF